MLQLGLISMFGFEDGLSFNGPIWSVSTKIFAYTLFFLYIRYVPANLLTLAHAVILAMGAYMMLDTLLILCAVYFFAGCLVYGLYTQLREHSLGPSLLIWVLAPLAAFSALDMQAGTGLPTTVRLMIYFGLILLGLALAESGCRLPRPIHRLRAIGDITYSTYLLHTPIQMTFLMAVAYGWVSLEIVLSPVFAAAYFLFVCGAAYATFHVFELSAKSWVRARMQPKD